MFIPGACYHVYNHANGKERLFPQETNYGFFLKRYAAFITPVADTFAYNLLPDHFHFLLKIKDAAALRQFVLDKYRPFEEGDAPEKRSERFLKLAALLAADEQQVLRPEETDKLVTTQFQNLCNSYTQALNKQQNRKGSLFQPNLRRVQVDDVFHLQQLFWYIHGNAVHHGLVARAEDWLHCSYHAYRSGGQTKLSRAESLSWFDAPQEAQRTVMMLRGFPLPLEWD